MKIETLVIGELNTNVYLIASAQGNCAVVDPAADAAAILRVIQANGYTLRCIFITHSHHDHIGAVKELQEKTGATVSIGAPDYETLCNPERFNARYQSHVMGKVFAADTLVRDGDRLALDELEFTVLATPGHSQGGVCYLCAGELFAGDTLFAGTVGRTDLYGGDFSAMLSSVKRLAALPGNYNVYPGHGPATTMDAERKGNPYINGTYLEMDEY